MEGFELIAGVGAVPLIIGLMQLAKSLGLPSKLAGLGAVVLGVGMSFLYSYYSAEIWYTALVTGLAVGLSAAGLYSVVKNALE